MFGDTEWYARWRWDKQGGGIELARFEGGKLPINVVFLRLNKRTGALYCTCYVSSHFGSCGHTENEAVLELRYGDKPDVML